MAFANGPLLNQGAIEAILLCGTEEQKKLYVPNLVSGKWAGTMDLTEPQAGSDLAQVRTKAVPEGDHYRLTGQKIFITFGEHDYTENIIHLSLARMPNAPDGVKGISLFITPKYLVNPDGSLGERNDIYCAGIEHKLGIHASPTCTMNYGDKGQGAIGYLVGKENEGLKYMFIMMNLARFSVGVQGIGQADRAYQAALAYARERVQSKEISAKEWTPVRIFDHPDVRRMLMDIKSQVEAMRSVAFYTSFQLDNAHANPDEKARADAQGLVEFFTPIVKAWSTEVSTALVSEALQVFGGMGYVEEAGVAQYYRDVRIAQIYEGTTGIQANDLLGRKFLKDMGKTATRLIGEIQARRGLAHVFEELAAEQVVGLNARRAFVDLRDAHVAVVLRDAGFLDESPFRRRLAALRRRGSCAVSVDHALPIGVRNSTTTALRLLLLLVRVEVRVDRVGSAVKNATARIASIGALHIHQHAAHVGMLDDAHRRPLFGRDALDWTRSRA